MITGFRMTDTYAACYEEYHFPDSVVKYKKVKNVPAKIAICCFVFLLVLYATFAVDWAVASAFIVFSLLSGFESGWYFVTSFLIFAFYLIFTLLNVKIAYFGDLSIASYLVFAVGVFTYFRQGQRQKFILSLPFLPKLILSFNDLFKFGGILLLVLLLYPLTDIYLAAVIGYIVFIYVFKNIDDGRYAFFVALVFLSLCPFLLIYKKEKQAEVAAIFTYYFLVIGVVQEIIDMVRNPQEYQEEEEEKHEKRFLLRSEKVRILRLSTQYMQERAKYSIVGKLAERFNMRLIATIIAAFISGFVLVYVAFNPNLGGKYLGFLPFIPKAQPTLTPAPTIESVATPTPTPEPSLEDLQAELASDTAKLKVSVLNATGTKGLAASIAAQLKTAGFKNVTAGNADNKDLEVWQIAIRDENPKMVTFLKKILDLQESVFLEATGTAKVDIEIIIGLNR